MTLLIKMFNVERELDKKNDWLDKLFFRWKAEYVPHVSPTTLKMLYGCFWQAAGTMTKRGMVSTSPISMRMISTRGAHACYRQAEHTEPYSVPLITFRKSGKTRNVLENMSPLN